VEPDFGLGMMRAIPTAIDPCQPARTRL